MKTYQISASIVVYRNDPEELAASIRSVVNSPVRVLCTVVDNSPQPDLRDTVEANGARYIFAGQNLGFGRAHNLALHLNRGIAEFYLIQNPDICFSAGVLPELYQVMKSRPDFGLLMPQVRFPDGTEQRLCKRLPDPADLIVRRFGGRIGQALFGKRLQRYELRNLDMSVAREIPSLSGCFMLVRDSALESAGPFDERFFMYMEDVDLCRRIGRHYKTVFYPHVSVAHGYAKGSYRHFALLRYHARSAIRYFSKWGWFVDDERLELNARTAMVTVDQKKEIVAH